MAPKLRSIFNFKNSKNWDPYFDLCYLCTKPTTRPLLTPLTPKPNFTKPNFSTSPRNLNTSNVLHLIVTHLRRRRWWCHRFLPPLSSLKQKPQQAVHPSSVLSAETKPSIKFLVLCSSIPSMMVEETNLDLVVNVCIPARSLPRESSDHRHSKVGMSCSLFYFFVWLGRDEEQRGIEKSDALGMEKSDGWRGPLLLLGVKGLELIRAISGVWVKSSA